MPSLFSPLDLRSLALPNRIVVSPMCQYSADDGSATDWHVMSLGQYAAAGPGLVLTEATHVSAAGRITHRCLGLYSDENEAALARIVAFYRRYGASPLGAQLAHAGRKAATQVPWEGMGPAHGADAWAPVAPSALAYDEGWHLPHALSREELRGVRDEFVAATVRAARLGLDTIELHAAHGYLLHEFLSPLSNARDDEYGGSLVNRMRFPLEVFAAVRAAWPQEKPLGIRISASDFVDGGWALPDSIALAHELRALGCDFIDASGGGLSPHQHIDVFPAYQAEFAAAIRRATGVPTIAVGRIDDPRLAAQLIEDGVCDAVAIARAFIRQPRFVWDAADDLGAEAYCAPQFLRGRRLGTHDVAPANRAGRA
jgi:2,4-dienoyl-CoA reductase-like NADH-dependent reductase (Old Yellow Enzyme family)